MARLFGTDGVRGIANEKLTCELAMKIGRATACVLAGEVYRPKIVIGRDTRISGEMLESALASGITSMGADALLLGVIPTPAIAYITGHLDADAGIVISASHNTFEYNGIKIFNKDGYKLADEVEDQIEALIAADDFNLPIGEDIGRRISMKKARDEYISFLVNSADCNLGGLKIVLDMANGAASGIATEVFSCLGANVASFHDEPDGININDNCGSTKPGRISRLVAEYDADIGLAFDGDADRLICADEHGTVRDGDTIMAICAIDLKNHGGLLKDTLVATVMSNLGLDIAMKAQGITLEKTDVGDRYVLEQMLVGGFALGGEQSGHIIYLGENTTGDGIYSAIKLCCALKNSGKSLSELSKVIKILPQVLINAKVDENKKFSYNDDEEITAQIEKLEAQMQGKGRVLIRPSGTESLVRVMIEGEDRRIIEKLAFELAKLIERKLK